MTIYRGTVGNKKLAETLHTMLVSEGFTEISSDISTNGRVYKSNGVDGKNEFYISIKDPATYFLTVWVYEKYIPNPMNGLPGTFQNGYENNSITWNAAATTAREEVEYVVNINKDRLIIYVQGKKAETNRRNSLTYIGMPKRYSDKDTGSGFAGIAYTANGHETLVDRFRSLRNRALQTQSQYQMDFYIPTKSYGWGNKLFTSPIFLGEANEGCRGELEDILVVEKTEEHTEIQHGDTFVRNGKTYMLIVPISNGSYSLNTGYDYFIQV